MAGPRQAMRAQPQQLDAHWHAISAFEPLIIEAYASASSLNSEFNSRPQCQTIQSFRNIRFAPNPEAAGSN